MTINLEKFNRETWLISQLRRISSRYPPAYQYINERKEYYYITSKKGKQLKRVRFKCEICSEYFPKKEMRLDHIIPCKQAGETIWQFADRLFCDSTNYQYICTGCHEKKTKIENEERKKYRKLNKK